jgi:short-subunit dehydrogenase
MMLTTPGIGAMMARTLDASGAAKVYIIGRRMEKLQSVVAQAKRKSIVAVQGDITSKDDLESIARRVEVEAGFVNGECVSISVCNKLSIARSCYRELGNHGTYS